MQADGNGDGKTVQHTANGGALFGHIDEDLAQCTVVIFAGAEEECLAVDLGLLCEPRRLAGMERRSTIMASWRLSDVSALFCTRLFISSSNSSMVSFDMSTMVLAGNSCATVSVFLPLLLRLFLLSDLLFSGWLSFEPSR